MRPSATSSITANCRFIAWTAWTSESWYNKSAHPYWRLQRHLQYERYIINDVFPLMWNKNWTPHTAVTGCSFGAYHAVNFAFRHPDMVNACVSMGGAFDIRQFLDGWYSEDVYFNNPPDYLANCTDGWKYNHMRTVLATGEHDMCWDRNETVCRRFCGPRASGMRFTCGATAAITIGRGGGRWRGCIVESRLSGEIQIPRGLKAPRDDKKITEAQHVRS